MHSKRQHLRDNDSYWLAVLTLLLQNSIMEERNKLFETLNDKQIEVVMATEGKVRAIAGDNSGKTRVLAQRNTSPVNETGINIGNTTSEVGTDYLLPYGVSVGEWCSAILPSHEIVDAKLLKVDSDEACLRLRPWTLMRLPLTSLMQRLARVACDELYFPFTRYSPPLTI